MIHPEVKKILEGAGATPFGKALQQFLDEQLKELNDVSKCTSWEDTLGRKHAVEIIEKLFSHMNVKKSEVKKTQQYE